MPISKATKERHEHAAREALRAAITTARGNLPAVALALGVTLRHVRREVARLGLRGEVDALRARDTTGASTEPDSGNG